MYGHLYPSSSTLINFSPVCVLYAHVAHVHPCSRLLFFFTKIPVCPPIHAFMFFPLHPRTLFPRPCFRLLFHVLGHSLIQAPASSSKGFSNGTFLCIQKVCTEFLASTPLPCIRCSTTPEIPLSLWSVVHLPTYSIPVPETTRRHRGS